MAKNILAKFEYLVRKLNYSQIQLKTLDPVQIETWARETMPLVVKELKDLNWNLKDEKTWTEVVLSNALIDWYGRKVCLYITTSYLDFKLAQKIFKTRCFANYRKSFGIDAHSVVMVDPVIFLTPESLDSIYCSLDFDKGWSVLDFSHYDEEDNLEDEFEEEFGWLGDETTKEEMDDEPDWTILQKHIAFR